MPRKPIKNTKKVTKKYAPTIAPEAHECQCGAACQCGCRHGKFKKFVVIVIVFLLGFAVAKVTCCHKRHHMRAMPEIHPVFENGCLDMQSIHCPKMVEALQSADVNADGCVSLEEFSTTKEAMKREMHERHHHMPKSEEM
ncbi:MAG: hypothetical protein J5742_03695 [Alphaproteobacteria bacterium]|nr:hypothetical protein [Alphaproteobacteria bacterium]